MNSHSKTYEQYCWVKQRNIVMEETIYHNGRKKVICTNLIECDSCGGCKNSILCKLWEADKNDSDKYKIVGCEELTN